MTGHHPSWRDATDAALLRRSRKDDGAFRVIFDRHAPSLQRFLEARCEDRDTALDLTAEVFARAWLHRTRFRDECDGSARPWLLGIARNVLRSSVQRERVETEARRRLGIEVRDLVVEPDAGWLVAGDDEMQTAVSHLPEAERAAVTLRVVESLSYADVADRLACTEAAARVRVHRGLTRLRATFKETS
jgi:RNA polymerase sigma factor (sigma-70 family)